MLTRLCAAAFVAVTLAVPADAKEPRVKGDRLAFTMCDLAGDTVSSADERFAGKALFVTAAGDRRQAQEPASSTWAAWTGTSTRSSEAGRPLYLALRRQLAIQDVVLPIPA